MEPAPTLFLSTKPRIVKVWVPESEDPIPQPRQRHRVMLPSIDKLARAPRNDPRALFGWLAKNVHTGNYTERDHPVQFWKSKVGTYVRRALMAQGIALPITFPVRIDLAFYFAREYHKSEKPLPLPKRPDRDNLQKAVEDALVDGRVLVDDAQVYDGRVNKWSVKPGRGGAWVMVHLPAK